MTTSSCICSNTSNKALNRYIRLPVFYQCIMDGNESRSNVAGSYVEQAEGEGIWECCAPMGQLAPMEGR